VHDQIIIVIMIATTMSAATSEGARSNVFDPAFAISSSGGMAYVGARNSPRSHRAVSGDFIGSTGSTTR
jgi:hypothetical protein